MLNLYNYNFFLGSNSSNGFANFFDELYSNQYINFLYLLKGGPGCGKSSFMKKIAAYFESLDITIERIYCSSDPYSLDAVILKDLGIAFADGTSPHVLEPKYPGVKQTYLDFSHFWDDNKLNLCYKEIISLTDSISNEFHGAFRLLCAAFNLKRSVFSQVIPYTEISRIKKRAETISKREIPKKSTINGDVYKRFLSAVTPYGIFTMQNHFNQKVYKLKDKYGLCPFFMEVILRNAISRGYNAYAFYCPLNSEKLEHVMIPELNLCFLSEHNHVLFDGDTYRCIHLDKYIDNEFFASKRKEFRQSLKDYSYIIEKACNKLEHAKSLHDELEKFYIPAMDFSRVDHVFLDTIEKLKQ